MGGILHGLVWLIDLGGGGLAPTDQRAQSQTTKER
jgi:hypothetical protein